MIKHLLLLLFLLYPYVSSAQEDTIYFKFEYIGENYVQEKGKHPNDPDKRDYFPFDEGRIYILSKLGGVYKQNLYFSYNDFTPAWMANQFCAQWVDSCQLKDIEFIDQAWIESHSLHEITTFLSRPNLIIMLYDTQQKSSKGGYLVRVYFSYTSTR